MNTYNVNKPADPAFILSCPRSGSTLLRYIVDTHSDIASPGELNLGKLCQDLYRVVSRTLGEVSTVADETEKNLIVVAEVKRIVSDLMNSYAAAKNKRIWCDKTPKNLESLDSLKEVFPEAKYICLYRNCMDVVHSCIECSKFGFMNEIADYVRQSPGNIVGAMINSWIDNTKKLLMFEQQNAAKCFRVKYESLVLYPSRDLKSLFEFLGVEWDASLLESVFSVQHDQGGGDPKVIYSNSIYKNSIGKGSTIHSDWIPKHLLEEMNALLEELDYPVFGPDWDSSPSPYKTIEPITNRSNIISTIKDFFADYLPQKLSGPTNKLPASNVIYKFIITGDGGGVWMIDLTKPSTQIITRDGNADCTFTISSTDFVDIINGELNPAAAFMQNKLHVSGDLKQAEMVGQVLFKRV